MELKFGCIAQKLLTKTKMGPSTSQELSSSIFEKNPPYCHRYYMERGAKAFRAQKTIYWKMLKSK